MQNWEPTAIAVAAVDFEVWRHFHGRIEHIYPKAPLWNIAMSRGGDWRTAADVFGIKVAPELVAFRSSTA